MTLRQGGPQVNHAQLLAAGRLDFNLAPNSFIPLNFLQENIPMVAVAAIFQKDPSVLIAHPGQGIEKFEGVACRSGELGTPLLEGTLGHIECKVVNSYEGGDHTIYVGEIQGARASGDRPLLFFKGKYYRLPS